MSTVDHEKTISSLFERLSARDFTGVVELMHDDVEFDLAFAPEMLPMPVQGKQSLTDLLTNVIGAMFEPFRIDVTAFYPGADGQTIVAEYASDAVVKHNGRPYANRYVGIFRFDGDRIAFWREYHNPEAATAALA
jgi:ketosteroid isomerase-like protein